jgi:hypothetical protein
MTTTKDAYQQAAVELLGKRRECASEDLATFLGRHPEMLRRLTTRWAALKDREDSPTPEEVYGWL